MNSKKILYISTLPKESQTGGANAVNFHTFKELQKHFNCGYYQIKTPENLIEKYLSKFLRKIINQPGKFSFYSSSRLKKISEEFKKVASGYDLIFFRGFTPWILCKPTVPYMAYNDVNFQQFFENTFSYEDFESSDIQRIFDTEKAWLSNSKKVFFESVWGSERCQEQYGLSQDKLLGLGRGGSIQIPEFDTYNGGADLLLVANNFYQKGGDLVFEVFKELYKKYSRLRFHIVGGEPEDKVLKHSGVIYHGRLNKENHQDNLKLRELYSKSFLLMHLTREDTNPLVITEAGYFGCPSVSVNQFAIPELIKSMETGVLLPYNPGSDLIKKTISSLLNDKEKYLMMRKAAWKFNHENFSWDEIGLNLKTIIDKTLLEN
ncbi:glycosyltransferase family 4 protein [Mangrovimonas futianensis]|uniref:glycosyltransferase family 4 protein n=1 Tax=Mangrovimonas futianensis TaxID=2895523 RepID=UPI001E30383F|nr:glycosyltransferase family 4 protein [Mangrovimonas futianensis]MCF1420245.1 glycosyltransferase family 4 protein [Mangrovimonas futianensis]